MKKILLFLVFLAPIVLFSQHLPKFSNYDQLKNIINPAAVFENSPTVKIFYRNQWLGFAGAPISTGIDFTYKSFDKSAFGAYFLSDKAGIFNQNIFHLNYAYSLQVTDENYINFGLAGGFNLYKLNYQDLILYNPNDPYIASTMSSAFLPDINLGVMFTNIKDASDYAFASLAKKYPIYYVGVSGQHVLGVISNNGVIKDNSYMNRHINLMAGIMHPVGVYFQLQENFLLKYTLNAPPQLDLGVKFYYMKNYWTGISYRTSNDIVTHIGFQYKYVIVAYSFDFSFFKLPGKTSHEIILGFRIIGKDQISKY